MIRIFQKIRSFIKIKIQRFYFLWKHHNLILSLTAQLKHSSLHGVKHWLNVGKVGAYLCLNTGTNYEVVLLFAYLHDIKRINEDYDPNHGQRAALLVEGLFRDKKIRISRDQLELLAFACRHHNNSDIKSNNLTIQTCWDADRLDLWRVGIMPDPALLNTEFAKTDMAINFLR